MPGLVAETAKIRQETAKLREVAKKDEANVVVLGGLQEEVLAVKRPVAELSPVSEKARDVYVNAKKKVRSLGMKFLLLKHKKA